MKPAALRVSLTLGACLLALAAWTALSVSLPQGDSFQTPSLEPMEPIGPISEGIVVTQLFPARGKLVSTISIQLATYRRANKGRLRVAIAKRESNRWKVIATRTMRKRELKDNEFLPLVFDPPLKVKLDQALSITITADKAPAEGIAWWGNPHWRDPEYPLFVNGEPLASTARIKVNYAPKTGRIATALPDLFKRAGLFLNPFWRTVLILSILAAVIATMHLTLWSGGSKEETD